MSVSLAESASLMPRHAGVRPRLPGEGEAWLGLGSNLGDRQGTIHAALLALDEWLVARSPLYKTSPWGVRDQPWFLNGVVRLEWSGTSRDLLNLCLAIEEGLGRSRGVRFGPRLIDLDVLVLGPDQVDESGLCVPHPGIASRRSVLEPWADLCSELLIPGLDQTVGVLCDAAQELPNQDVQLFVPTPVSSF